MSYDAAGNIEEARKYESGILHQYHYHYTLDNQLDLIQKDGTTLQTKEYDDTGRIYNDYQFDARGFVSQKNIMGYDKGLLVTQTTLNTWNEELSKTTYSYDAIGNIKESNLRVNRQGNNLGVSIKHQYSYDFWNNYQQSEDLVSQTFDEHATTYGKSTRLYDVNGQLSEAKDAIADNSGKTNSTHYWTSGIEGIKAREDKDGQTSYLTVAGKTIGDFHRGNQAKQELTVYGGFTPSGSTKRAPATDKHGWKSSACGINMEHVMEDAISRGQFKGPENGILPESTQDNLGAYTIQSGDTLESIALQVYGDSSLWYLIADANGITDKNAIAGNNSQLHTGQRINLPPASTGQHHTNATHKVMNANEMIGNTTATAAMPPTPPPPARKNNIFAKIVVGVVAIVATVLTAGILGALVLPAGTIAGGFSGIFTAGAGLLTGSIAVGSTATTMG